MSGDPHPKSKQLARGTRRYRRRVASPKQWQAILEAKQGPCRVCAPVSGNGHVPPLLELHHLVPRSQGGDDTADNIVPLCRFCHASVTTRAPGALQALGRSLTDAEYAYVIGKLGEDGMRRLFGVTA